MTRFGLFSYELHGVLGEGTFGQVLHATWSPPPDMGVKGPVDVALKVIPKKKVKGNESLVFGGQSVETYLPQSTLSLTLATVSTIEMHVLEGLDHPNIVSSIMGYDERMKI